MKTLAKTLLAFFLLSAVTAASAAGSASATGRTPAEVSAADTVARVFDSPFGIRDIAYCSLMDFNFMYDVENTEAVPDENAVSVHQALISHGYTEDKGYKILYIDENGDDGEIQNSRLEISLPATYAFPIKSLHPREAVISRTPENVTEEYVFDNIGDGQSAAAHFRRLFRAMKASRDEESAGERYDYYGQQVFTIDETAESTTVACQYRRKHAWWRVPAGYYPAWGWTELPADGPYNNGAESFASFIKKFNADAGFRMERTAHSDFSQHEERLQDNFFTMDNFYKMVVRAANACGLFPLQGRAVKNPEKKEFDDWYVVGEWIFPTADKVIYSGWDRRKCDEYDNNSVMFLFERLDDGKWYCTGATFFGSMMDDAVQKQMN